MALIPSPTLIEMIEFIDAFLAHEEDYLHGEDGDDCTQARVFLALIKKSLPDE